MLLQHTGVGEEGGVMRSPATWGGREDPRFPAGQEGGRAQTWEKVPCAVSKQGSSEAGVIAQEQALQHESV